IQASPQDTQTTGDTYKDVATKANQLLDQFLKLSAQCTQNHHYIESVLTEGHIKVKPARGEDEEDADEAIWVQSSISAIVAYYQDQVKKIQ
ncbi:hypothetical protein ACKI14_48995, partial [Streptomyces turgidiscabies]|uniref:hypothetical protein n=1 Tax=Streptomyces turgidiscabies TaxID=85558 RepID=UPI0038F7B2E0